MVDRMDLGQHLQKAMAVTLIVVDIDLREIGRNIIRRCRCIVEGADRVFFITCLSKALSNMVVSVVKFL
jgi:hypothetical protein